VGHEISTEEQIALLDRLVKAVAADDADEVSSTAAKLKLVRDIAGIRNEHGDLLSLAIKKNSRHCIRILARYGMDANRMSPDVNQHPLEEALNARAVVSLEMLLRSGAKPNSPHSRFGTILHAAAAMRLVDSILPCLLSHQGDPNERGIGGLRPLHVAVRHNQPQNVSQLLERGAEPNATDDNGQAPLHHAITAAVYDPIVAMLLDHGADPLRPDLEGLSPLDLARRGAPAGIIKEMQAQFDWAAMLRSRLLAPERQSGHSQFLSGCVERVRLGDRKKLIDFIMHGKAVWRAQSTANSSPLWLALDRKRFDLVAVLLANGLGLTDTNEEGRCVVHGLLMATTSFDVLKPFLEFLKEVYPASLSRKDNAEKTPLELVTAEGSEHDKDRLTELFAQLIPPPTPPPYEEPEVSPKK
jgi:hypothetical protein